MKKTINKMISFLLVSVIICGFSVSPAFAETDNTKNSSNGFYVTSESVPREVVEYTKTSIGGMIQDLFDLSTVTVGTPFKVAGSNLDLFYFIVYSQNKIVGTYRVYEGGNGYTGIFSENTEIITGLGTIKDLTSANKPARIIAGRYDDIYAVIDSNIYTVLEDYAGNVTNQRSMLSLRSASNPETVVDVSSGIDFDLPKTKRAAATYKYLQVGWAETQSSLPWCMAYVTASIVRYKTKDGLSTHSARSVMKTSYPNLSTSDLEKRGLDTDKAAEYANGYNLYPSYTASRRTYSQVKSDINADTPLAFICDNVDTGAKKSHAFVCRGYNDNSGTSFYSIWNPWYEKFERIYTSDNTYVNSSGTAKYLWSATMYNWK